MKPSYLKTTFLCSIALELILASFDQASAQQLYWSELFPGAGPGGNSAASSLKQSDISGNDIATVIPTSASHSFGSIAYAPSSNKLYWTDRGMIENSNLDGSNIQTVITTNISGQPASVRGLAIDSIHSLMYWTDESHETVTRAGLNGTGSTDVITGILSEDVAVDVAAARLLFADNVGGPEGPHDAIDISNLDGTSHHTIVNGIFQLTALDVDPVAQKVYWADVGLNALNDTSIHSANYDGSGQQTLISNLPDVILDLDVFPQLNAMLWSSRDDGTIKRADLNGANPHVVVSGLSNPGAVEVVVPEPNSGVLLLVGLLLCASTSIRQDRW